MFQVGLDWAIPISRMRSPFSSFFWGGSPCKDMWMSIWLADVVLSAYEANSRDTENLESTRG